MPDDEPTLPSACPPVGALHGSGLYYRYGPKSYGIGQTLKSSDWQLPWQKRLGEYAGRPEECIAWSHSIFDRKETLEDARKMEPWTRKKCIAELTLTHQHGVIQLSHSDVGLGHFDWWLPQNQNPPTATVVAEAVEK